MNDKTGRSSKLRLLLLFLMPGIIILTVVFEIQTNIEKNRANTDASVIINFMMKNVFVMRRYMHRMIWKTSSVSKISLRGTK